MSAAPIHIAGERLMLDPAGGLYWPEQRLLVVSDLHLEKSSAAALRGNLLPPWDTGVTLDRLTLLLRRYHPATVVALGDSFHDRGGAGRMRTEDAARLRAMTAQTRFVWVLGNHDPAPPHGIAGDCTDVFAMGPLLLRHEGTLGADGGEICGHHHPKASVPARGTAVTRPCFVSDGKRVMMPAFGAYTGGLSVTDPAIGRLFPRGARVFLLGRERLFSFTLSQARQAGTTDKAGANGWSKPGPGRHDS